MRNRTCCCFASLCPLALVCVLYVENYVSVFLRSGTRSTAGPPPLSGCLGVHAYTCTQLQCSTCSINPTATGKNHHRPAYVPSTMIVFN